MPYSLMILRLSKTLLPLLVGIYFLLAGIDNMIDPSANRTYIAHVLSMDTVPVDSPLGWRALRSPAAAHLLLIGLTAWELATASLCLLGSGHLLRQVRGSRQEFSRAKGWAVAGLTCGLVEWLFFFLTLAGEWFQLWRGAMSAPLDVAARMFAVTALCLVYLTQDEGVPAITDASPRRNAG